MAPANQNPDDAAGVPELAGEHGLRRLEAGEVLSDRFVIERLAGRGGMGAVYRALDRLSGAPVAVKVIAQRGRFERRFAQEAGVLAELSHPAIVRYVAHGETAPGQPYLAMQWLDGEDLAQRLAASPLTVGESLDVARRVAEGLAAAHARGVVHRDVKPSNVMLTDGQPARATLLDFGIARTESSGVGPAPGPITGSGVVLGTVGYMSPEQATGDKWLDARADVFALGSLLFQCLTGVPAFSGEHMVAVLAKVLREEAPHVRALRPELPEALDQLVARMLAKDRTSRPPDGGAVLAALVALGTVAGDAPPGVIPAPPGLSGSERRMVSVILARLEGPSQPVLGAVTNTHERLSSELSFVRDNASRHGGEAARLTDGTLLVTFSGGGATAMEQAGRAATCAHELRSMHPEAVVALATGFAQTTERVLVGEAIDRAAALLSGHRGGGALLDGVTAGLVDGRFEVRDESGARILGVPRRDDEEARTLLGKPTPFVGRDRELAMLQSLLDQCIEERSPRAVLLTAPPGIGKSRLRQEFLRRVREKSTTRIVLARADSMGAGSAFVLARQIVQRAAGLDPSDPWEVQHGALKARLAERIGAREAGLIAEFVCELLGVPVQTNASPILRSARGDPRLLADWLRTSFEDWLEIEAREPLLLVLEDLHWGDAPTVTYLSRVLRGENLPLMVLALGRPEVHEAFPKLWAGALHEVALPGLGKRVAEQFVRSVLNEPDGAAVARVVERASGNAFYLEELVRAVAEGHGDALPETVVAMAQSRLERLEPRVRRVLRAASVLGERFWLSGLASIVGSEEEVTSSLAALEEQEVVATSRGERFPGEREYLFRHGLIRDAAYATLTVADRRVAHRRAAEWLERVGEKEPRILADHFELGGEPHRAVPWLASAARAAIDGGDVDGALALSNRGVRLGANGQDRGSLLLVQGMCGLLSSQPEVETLKEAAELLEEGSASWWLSTSLLVLGASIVGRPGEALPYVQRALGTEPGSELTGPQGQAVHLLVVGMVLFGQGEFAGSFLARYQQVASETPDCDPVFLAWLKASWCQLLATSPREGLWQPERAYQLALESADEMAAAGFATGEVSTFLYLGAASLQVGRYEEADAACRRCISLADRTGMMFLAQWARLVLAMSLTRRHRHEEALSVTLPLQSCADENVVQHSHVACAEAYARMSRFDLALGHAQAAVEGTSQPGRYFGGAVLARTYLSLGRAEEALATIERTLRESVPGSSEHEVDALTTRAQALYAVGKVDEARSAIEHARSKVLQIAGGIANADLRRSFLVAVEPNARALELAAAWSGAEAT